MTEKKINDLFGKPLNIVNLGLSSMAQSVREQGVQVVEVDWRPPAEGVPRLRVTRTGVNIEAANETVCTRIKQGRPVLVGMGIARQVIPGMHERMILHAGPPITWERMCGPQRGAVMGALIYEGIAQDEAEAAKIAASGSYRVRPLPPPPFRRTDGGRGLAVYAGVHPGKQGLWQPGFLHAERGSR